MTEQELRELDARVHREVFGLDCRVHASGILIHDVESPAFPGRGSKPMIAPVPRYSTVMSCAWDVVEKLTEGDYVKVRCEQSHYHGDYCTVVAGHEPGPGDLVKRDAREWGEAMPLAICLAALKAVAAGAAPEPPGSGQ